MITFADKATLFSNPIFQSVVWMAINEKIASILQDPTFPADPMTSSQKLAVENLTTTHDRSKIDVLYPVAMVAAIADQLFTNKTLQQVLDGLNSTESDTVIRATVNQYWDLIANTQHPN